MNTIVTIQNNNLNFYFMGYSIIRKYNNDNQLLDTIESTYLNAKIFFYSKNKNCKITSYSYKEMEIDNLL